MTDVAIAVIDSGSVHFSGTFSNFFDQNVFDLRSCSGIGDVFNAGHIFKFAGDEKRLLLCRIYPAFSAVGGTSHGVDADTVKQIRSEFLETNYRNELASLGEYKYENKVSKSDTNPNIKMFLTNEEFLGYGFYPSSDDLSKIDEKLNFIPKGKYLFLQGIGSKDDFDTIEKASETLFLESLWQELNLKDTTYLRFLVEGEKTVFQLFREIL